MASVLASPATSTKLPGDWEGNKMLTSTATTALFEPTQPAAFRRICSWCRRDLGALEHYCQDHSYGICETCAHCYFAYLYEPDAAALPVSAARELQVGVS
jgi:hypothetical protein